MALFEDTSLLASLLLFLLLFPWRLRRLLAILCCYSTLGRHPVHSPRRCCAAQRVRLRGLSPRTVPADADNLPRHTWECRTVSLSCYIKHIFYVVYLVWSITPYDTRSNTPMITRIHINGIYFFCHMRLRPCSNGTGTEDNPLGWWKQHDHLFCVGCLRMSWYFWFDNPDHRRSPTENLRKFVLRIL